MTTRRSAALALALVSIATQKAIGQRKEFQMFVDHVDVELDGHHCEAYFFGGWSTYSHPVTPRDPMYLEQALLRRSFYRAWSCVESGQSRFLLFEAIANEIRPLDGSTRPSPSDSGPLFFDLREGKAGIALGASLTPSQAMSQWNFGLRFRNGSHGSWAVRQRLTYSYRYHYTSDGALDKVTMTNAEGKVSELQY